MSVMPRPMRWCSIRPRFVIGLAAITVVCGTALLWYDWRYHPPMGHGPAGPSVSESLFAKPWSTDDIVLVGMGDSVVTGFGAPPGFGFFDLLSANPTGDEPDMNGKNLRRVLPGLRILNLAENSTSSGDHLKYQVKQLPAHAANVRGIVVLSTGGIDLIHNYGASPPRDEAVYGATWEEGQRYAAQFGQRLDRLLDEITRRFPGGCEIFVASIFDPTDGVGDIEKVDPILRLLKPLPPWPDGLKVLTAFNEQIRAAASRRPNVHVVDVQAALIGHGLHCRDKSNSHYHADDPTYWYFFNHEDPNRRGYDAIRRAFLVEIARVMNPGN
jgi:hypothetical protein